MNPSDPLAELRGLSMPGAPFFDWWPLSIAWWVVLILVIVATYLLARFIKRQVADSWYKQAMNELGVIREQNQAGDISQQDLLIRCSALCRRVAMAVEGREAIAGLTGMAWRLKLDELSESQEFTTGIGKFLDDRLWQKPKDNKDEAHSDVLDLVSRVIKNNKPGLREKGRLL